MTMREGYLMKHGSGKLKVWQKKRVEEESLLRETSITTVVD
jgi:hypothetical protein